MTYSSDTGTSLEIVYLMQLTLGDQYGDCMIYVTVTGTSLVMAWVTLLSLGPVWRLHGLCYCHWDE